MWEHDISFQIRWGFHITSLSQKLPQKLQLGCSIQTEKTVCILAFGVNKKDLLLDNGLKLSDIKAKPVL